MPLKPIDQQVVVVCGASSEIGRVTAQKVAERGAKVVVTARNAAGLQSLVDQIRAAGGIAVAQPADVTGSAQVQAVADRSVQEFGPTTLGSTLRAGPCMRPLCRLRLQSSNRSSRPT